MILGYLEPVDRYVAKLSCRTFLMNVESFKACHMDLLKSNPWDLYLARARCENFEDEKLLCVLCREKLPRSHFGPYIEKSALERSCQDPDGAIEFGQSRLSQSVIIGIICAAPIRPKNHSMYPREQFALGVLAGLRIMCTTPGQRLILQSPFEYDMESDGHNYHEVEQEVEYADGNAILHSTLRLSGPSFGSPSTMCPITSEDEAIGKLQSWLKEFPVNGGFWACPHIPIESRDFCKAVLILHAGMVKDESYRYFLECSYCGAEIVLSGDITWDNGNRMEVTGIGCIMYGFEGYTQVAVKKYLGKWSDVREEGLEPYWSHHFSRRIKAGSLDDG